MIIGFARPKLPFFGSRLICNNVENVQLDLNPQSLVFKIMQLDISKEFRFFLQCLLEPGETWTKTVQIVILTELQRSCNANSRLPS